MQQLPLFINGQHATRRGVLYKGNGNAESRRETSENKLLLARGIYYALPPGEACKREDSILEMMFRHCCHCNAMEAASTGSLQGSFLLPCLQAPVPWLQPVIYTLDAFPPTEHSRLGWEIKTGQHFRHSNESAVLRIYGILDFLPAMYKMKWRVRCLSLILGRQLRHYTCRHAFGSFHCLPWFSQHIVYLNPPYKVHHFLVGATSRFIGRRNLSKKQFKTPTSQRHDEGVGFRLMWLPLNL